MSPTSALRLSFDNISPETEEPPDGNKRLWGVPVPPFVSEKVVSWIEEEFNEAPVFYNGNSVLKKVNPPNRPTACSAVSHANHGEQIVLIFQSHPWPPATGHWPENMQISTQAVCSGACQKLTSPPSRNPFPMWVMCGKEEQVCIRAPSASPQSLLGAPTSLTDCCIVSGILGCGAGSINGMGFPSKSQMQLPSAGKLHSYIKSRPPDLAIVKVTHVDYQWTMAPTPHVHYTQIELMQFVCLYLCVSDNFEIQNIIKFYGSVRLIIVHQVCAMLPTN